MIKILFLIHDLGQGGAEKVLVNLVNNMNPSLFEVHVTALFAGGVNEQFLAPHIRYRTVFNNTFPGNSKIMKLLTPEQLHKKCVTEKYDIEVSYLEGPSARIVSGCNDINTRLVCWIHSNHFSMKEISASFRSSRETIACYRKFHSIVCVSKETEANFCSWIPIGRKCRVLYNTIESDSIKERAEEEAPEIIDDGTVRLIAVGTLKAVKGFDRLLRIMKRLHDEQEAVHLYILGKGPLQKQFEEYIAENVLQEMVTLLGYHINPYKFVKKCDLFVCSSISEGFSTAATEALIVGTPVCTVDVSGMAELLGNHGEYGIITPNSEEALYDGIKRMIMNPETLSHYKRQAELRGKYFDKQATVIKTEEFFKSLVEYDE